MPYDGKLLARARARLETIRTENREEQRRRQAAVYARLPEIERLDAAMRGQMLELVRLTVARRPDAQERIARLREENLNMQARRAELLTEHGYAADYLDEIVSCPRCRDSGVYKNAPCVCLERLYNRELTKELGVLMQTGDESFENFDLDLYSAQPEPGQTVSPRETMSMVYDACREFVSRFHTDSPHLLLQGGTGLGKTTLSACIARAVADKGFSVCYDTAAAALEAFEKQKFSRDPEEAEAAAAKVRRMLSCDLMILDDLGTEMVTPISVSALYTLVNTRLTDGKKTVISTNLTDEELRRKYNPQICSRLEGEFLRLPFVGTDIRLLKNRPTKKT